MKSSVILLGAVLAGCLELRAEDYTVQPVVDIRLTGSVWNLTDYEPMGPEIDFHSELDDEITSFWIPGKRLDFVNRNDSVYQTCAEIRKYRTVFSPGILCDVKNGGYTSLPLTFRGRIYQREFVHGNGQSTISPPVKGRVVTIDGSEEAGATVTHSSVLLRWTLSNDSIVDISSVDDSLMCETIVDRYILTTQGRTFPMAFKRITRTRYMGQEVEADSMSWITTCTPEDAHINNEQLARRLKGNMFPDADYSLAGTRGDITVAVEGDELLVTISRADKDGLSSGPEGPVRMVVTDIVGRQYIDTGATADGTIRVNVGTLSRGEYLLQVIAGDGQVVDAVKFTR